MTPYSGRFPFTAAHKSCCYSTSCNKVIRDNRFARWKVSTSTSLGVLVSADYWPTPVKFTFSAPRLVLKVKVAVRVPLCVGVKVICTEQVDLPLPEVGPGGS